MDYIEVFQAMLDDMRSDLRHYLRGNQKDYLYRAQTDAADANAVNRLRLCWALAYSDKPVQEQAQIVRTLFDAECTALERSGNPGGSTALTLLTAMLKEYEPADGPLFERLTKAAPGCDPAACRIRPAEEMTLEDCMETAAATGMGSYLFTLTVCASRMYDAETVQRLREKYRVQGKHTSV